jgi:hypothetical protein
MVRKKQHKTTLLGLEAHKGDCQNRLRDYKKEQQNPKTLDSHVKVYKWIVLSLSISSDFWLRWLMHEA